MRRFLPFVLVACGTPAAPPALAPAPQAGAIVEGEQHFATLEQLTFGGENAEAYWSHDGRELVFQAHVPPPPADGHPAEDPACDRIFRLPIDLRKPVPVSSGEGATTCAYFLPGDEDIIYASTHLVERACPKKPDRSQGYVWPLYVGYDIFRAKRDGKGELMRLTETQGYDAEATVCKKDGSIVFTSVRDGDLELYRMDKDGKNVRRLTHTKGYDGGAFFSDDCSQIVWRASRPRPGKELEDYERLLAAGLVRPSKLELWVSHADGSDARQITALDAASFAPYFFPDGKRVIFSSNYGDPKGREFDLWAVNTDGTALERITHAPGFDGFPMFSPDGSSLVFASNRATAPGHADTNLFLARWRQAPPALATPRAEDALKEIVAWLADPAREGRGLGTQGLASAATYLEQRFSALGLEVTRQAFDAVTSVSLAAPPEVSIGGKRLSRVAPLAMSDSAEVAAPIVFADYGIVAPELGVDDYKGKKVKDKIVLVRRFVPEREPFKTEDAERRYGDLRKKAFEAKQRGAVGLLVVDLPEGKGELPPEARFPDSAISSDHAADAAGSAGLAMVMLGRDEIAPLLSQIDAKPARLVVKLETKKTRAENVIARLPGPSERAPLVIGAHYDHLGFGGRDSLAPGVRAPHVGADDNASGVAALLGVAELLAAKRAELARPVVFVAFAGEELGVLGSTHYVRESKDKPLAMLNMDMVGRLRANALTVLGGESAAEWQALLTEPCAALKLECATAGDGYGPSDQTPFYGAGTPVLHFFTGAHAEYHKPSDTFDRLNYSGLARIVRLVASTAETLARGDVQLSYKARAKQPSPMFGDRRSFGASLGTVPDYAGPPTGQKGVLLSGVRSESAADKAGLRRGDILVKLGRFAIQSVEDLMFALSASKPGESVKVEVVRDGKLTELSATFEERRR